MGNCKQKLDNLFPDWRYQAPPGSSAFYREGEQQLTNAVPAVGADISIVSLETTSSQLAVIHGVSLQGDQLEDSPIYAGTRYVPLAPSAIRGKLRWFVKNSETETLDAKSYGSPTPVGFQRLLTLSVQYGMSPIVVPPRGKIEIVIHPIDPTAGASISPDGAYLHAYLVGYFVQV